MNLLLHIVFTTNVVLALLAILLVSSRSIDDSAQKRLFLVAGVAVVLLRLAYIAVYFLASPVPSFSPDEQRYFFEIQQIAAEPWAWNPLSGTGPYYSVTPKMGMSYLYGVVLFMHGISSLYAMLLINVVFGLLTAVIVYRLTCCLTDDATPPLIAMGLVAVYPEMMFWTTRVLRENVVLFLVPALFYASIQTYQQFRLRHLVFVLAVVAALLLVRAQLVLFVVLIAAYLGAVSLASRSRAKAAVVSVAVGILLIVGFSLIEEQLRRAAGGAVVQLVLLEPEFLSTLLTQFGENVRAVLSPFARGAHGPAGLLIAPFTVLAGGMFLLATVGVRPVFRERATIAGMLIFATTAFIAVLALMGMINIRFRATVAPLVISLVAVAAHHYWRRARLPLVRW